MTQLHHEIQVAASLEKVWAVLADLEALQHYNSGLKHTKYLSTVRGRITSIVLSAPEYT